MKNNLTNCFNEKQIDLQCKMQNFFPIHFSKKYYKLLHRKADRPINFFSIKAIYLEKNIKNCFVKRQIGLQCKRQNFFMYLS